MRQFVRSADPTGPEIQRNEGRDSKSCFQGWVLTTSSLHTPSKRRYGDDPRLDSLCPAPISLVTGIYSGCCVNAVGGYWRDDGDLYFDECRNAAVAAGDRSCKPVSNRRRQRLLRGRRAPRPLGDVLIRAVRTVESGSAGI